jgi:N-hydroxyarylamine O-acetyltransferase
MVPKHEGRRDADPIDLDAYVARIGYRGKLDVSLATFRGLHLAHATTIPFENLDILLGRGISLELDALWAKLVTGRRGGYCFEQNTLFAAVLESLGFPVTRLAARVRCGSTEIRPRSHMLLSVEADGEPWLADVGFGGGGLVEPIRMVDARPTKQFGWTFRTHEEHDCRVLQSLLDGRWFDLYSFTQEPQYPIDYVVANHFVSTHPHSPFVLRLVVQRTDGKARWTLRNRELTEEQPDRKTARTLADDNAVLAALADIFGLHFPAATRFGYTMDDVVS